MTPFSRRSMPLVALALALASCTGGGTPAADPSGTPTPSAPVSPTLPPPPPAPLTGLPMRAEELLDRPVLAVKIDNHTLARPHAGLDRADIIYEEVVEGGITRFIALFHSRNASTIGPIRSARAQDIDVLADFGRPLLAYSGAHRYVRLKLRDANLVRVPHATTWRRDRSGPAPHNLFASTKVLYAAGAKARTTPAASLFRFGDVPIPPAPTATATPSPTGSASPTAEPEPAWPRGRRIRIPFAGSAWTAVWRYHSSGVYRRSHGDTPHRLTNGTQITAKNVLVLRFKTRQPGPGAPHPQPEIVFEGSGRATLFRDGVRIDGRWRRTGGGRTSFTDDQGRPMILAPGNTWIELVPNGVRPRFS